MFQSFFPSYMKYFKVFFLSIISAATVSILASCGDEERNGWSLKGNIAGANDSTLYIEKPSGMAWIILDSISTDASGNFSYTAKFPENGSQSIYRVRLGDRVVYFPVDSIETLTLTAKNSDMDLIHSLKGSVAAEGFNAVDSVIYDAVNRVGIDAAVNDSELIAGLGDLILGDTTCVVSYYIINKPIGDKKIFTPNDKFKVKLIGAVANKYNHYRPDDPRTKELTSLFENSRRVLRGGKVQGATAEARLALRPEIDFIRKDAHGKNVDLNEIIDRGTGITVVNLVNYADPQATANIMVLGDLYDKYKSQGLEIVQIGFDDNEAYWRQNALSMPWITMFSRPDESMEFLMNYNANPISSGPSNFIFSADGELVKRIDNPADLEAAVDEMM